MKRASGVLDGVEEDCGPCRWKWEKPRLEEKTVQPMPRLCRECLALPLLGLFCSFPREPLVPVMCSGFILENS